MLADEAVLRVRVFIFAGLWSVFLPPHWHIEHTRARRGEKLNKRSTDVDTSKFVYWSWGLHRRCMCVTSLGLNCDFFMKLREILLSDNLATQVFVENHGKRWLKKSVGSRGFPFWGWILKEAATFYFTSHFKCLSLLCYAEFLFFRTACLNLMIFDCPSLTHNKRIKTLDQANMRNQIHEDKL